MNMYHIDLSNGAVSHYALKLEMCGATYVNLESTVLPDTSYKKKNTAGLATLQIKFKNKLDFKLLNFAKCGSSKYLK